MTKRTVSWSAWMVGLMALASCAAGAPGDERSPSVGQSRFPLRWAAPPSMRELDALTWDPSGERFAALDAERCLVAIVDARTMETERLVERASGCRWRTATLRSSQGLVTKSAGCPWRTSLRWTRESGPTIEPYDRAYGAPADDCGETTHHTALDATGRPLWQLPDDAYAFCHGSRYFAVDRALVDARTGRTVAGVSLPDFDACAWDRSGRYLATQGSALTVVDTETGSRRTLAELGANPRSCSHHACTPGAVAFDPSGARLAVIAFDGLHVDVHSVR